MTTTTPHGAMAVLSIRDYEIPLFLGWPDNERAALQIISVDIDMRYDAPPPACDTDCLEDTLCYSWLTDQIKQATRHHTFHLIECVAKRIHSVIQSVAPFPATILVKIHKKPAIAGLNGGVTFAYGDFLS